MFRRVLDALCRSGFEDNAIVVGWSDHRYLWLRAVRTTFATPFGMFAFSVERHYHRALIETRMFSRAAHGDFFAVGMTNPKSLHSTNDDAGPPVATQAKDTPKVIEIELEPETIQTKKQVPNHRLKADQDRDIDSLRATFDDLRTVLDFG